MREDEKQKRLPRVCELFGLGLSRVEIAEAVGVGEGTIHKDILVLAGMKKLIRPPSKPDDVYQACFKRYAELEQQREKNADDRELLRVLLKPVDRGYIFGYIEGVTALWARLLIVDCPSDKKGYLELIEAVLETKIVRESTFTDIYRIWLGYVQEVVTGRSPLPKNRSEAVSACVHKLMVEHRREIMPIWTEEVFVQIDEQIDTLLPKWRKIIRGLFGIGQDQRSAQELALDLRISKGRVYAIKNKILYRLGDSSSARTLRRLVSPVGNILGESLAREALERKYREIEGSLMKEGETPCEKEQEPILSKLIMPIEELGLSTRARFCLQNTSIECIGDLIQVTERDLLLKRNFGRKSLQEIKKRLAERFGLALGTTIDPRLNVEIQKLRQQGQGP